MAHILVKRPQTLVGIYTNIFVIKTLLEFQTGRVNMQQWILPFAPHVALSFPAPTLGIAERSLSLSHVPFCCNKHNHETPVNVVHVCAVATYHTRVPMAAWHGDHCVQLFPTRVAVNDGSDSDNITCYWRHHPHFATKTSICVPQRRPGLRRSPL